MQSMLLSRLEKYPIRYRYYFSLGRLFLEDGNSALASEYFDEGCYIVGMLKFPLDEGIVSQYDWQCEECRLLFKRPPLYMCIECKEHFVCKTCFPLLSITHPFKYLSDHTFHRIPSERFPGSISAFIRRFEFECPFATTKQITRRKSMILERELTSEIHRYYHYSRGSICDLALLDSEIAEMLLARWSRTDR
jgi:hypothetical protein